jgi:hypothetical protein
MEILSKGFSAVVRPHTNSPPFIEFWEPIYFDYGNPCSLVKMGSCLGLYNAVTSSVGRFLEFRILLDNLSELTTHNNELPIVDAQGDYSDDGENPIDRKLSEFYPSELSRKFSGGVLLIIGSVGLWANVALWWSGWNHWRMTRRLALGNRWLGCCCHFHLSWCWPRARFVTDQPARFTFAHRAL